MWSRPRRMRELVTAVGRAALPSARLAATLLASSLLLGACSLFGPGKPKPADLPVISGPSAVTIAWRQKIGPAGIGFRPVYAAGSVWAASSKGRVYRINAEDGKLIWQVDLDKPLLAGVGADGNVLVVATRDGNLVTLDADGKPKWSASIGSEAVSLPVVGEGMVVVRTSSNRIFAFDANSGQRRWVFQRQNPPLVLRQTSVPAIDAGVVYAGVPGGRLVAIGADNGAVRWEAAVSQPKGSNEIERISDVVGATPVVDSQVCAASYQGRLGCFDAANGRPAWVRDFSSSTGPAFDGRAVALVDDSDQVHLFSRTGGSAWRNEKYKLRELSAPLITDNLVLVGDAKGFIHAMSRDDGTPIGRVDTDSSIITAPIAAGSLAVVQTVSGSVYGLSLKR